MALEHILPQVAKDGLELIKRLRGVIALFQGEDPPDFPCTLAMALSRDPTVVSQMLKQTLEIEKEMREMSNASGGHDIRKNIHKPEVICHTCGKTGHHKRCPCQTVFYCTVECQRNDFPSHKTICRERQQKNREAKEIHNSKK